MDLRDASSVVRGAAEVPLAAKRAAARAAERRETEKTMVRKDGEGKNDRRKLEDSELENSSCHRADLYTVDELQTHLDYVDEIEGCTTATITAHAENCMGRMLSTKGGMQSPADVRLRML